MHMPRNDSAFQHDKTAGHDEWLTPPEIIKALGPFDLDPCAPVVRPWDTATQHYTIRDNGLVSPWSGRVWLNPPYGPDTLKWVRRLAGAVNRRECTGTLLIFVRTDTVVWHDWIFPYASALLFLRGRLTFHTVNGEKGKTTAGAPSVLVGYGNVESDRLRSAWESNDSPPCINTGRYIEL
jgi:hypothetical protein